MIKNNSAENFRVITMSNEKFKRIKQNNTYFIDFIQDIGFVQVEGGKCPMGSDLKFKFIPEQSTDA